MDCKWEFTSIQIQMLPRPVIWKKLDNIICTLFLHCFCSLFVIFHYLWSFDVKGKEKL